MSNDKKNGNDDYYQRQEFEFFVKHGLETRIIKALKKEFNVREVLVIEPKDEDTKTEED